MLRDEDAELKMDADDPVRMNPHIMPVGTVREFLVRLHHGSGTVKASTSMRQTPTLVLPRQCYTAHVLTLRHKLTTYISDRVGKCAADSSGPRSQCNVLNPIRLCCSECKASPDWSGRKAV